MMKIAIIGTGKIVPEAMEAMLQAGGYEFVAIFARPKSKAKGEELAEKYGIKKVYTDYAELLADDEVEFVYIGNVNIAHYQYTKEALLAGKHIILEKPFCTSMKETQEIVDLAREKKLYLLEAVTILELPNFAKIRESIADIGRVRLVQCNYSQYSSRYDKYLAGEVLPALDPVFAGGALYDINIYNINAVVSLFGAPEKVVYHANIGFNGVDISGTVLLSYPDFKVTCTGAKDCDGPCFVTIQGEKGYIVVDGAPNSMENVTVKLRGKEPVTYHLNEYEHRMVHEFINFRKIYEEKNYKAMDAKLQVSLNVMKVAQEARNSAGIKFPAD